MGHGFRIALLLAIAFLPSLAHGERIALVIGNSRYASSVGPLRNTVNDSKAVAKALRALGFSVIEDHNVTRDELLKAMLKFRRKIDGAEVALFYYAGHGISLGGSNYLVPVRSGYNPQVDDPAALRLLAETKLFNAEQTVAEMGASGARCNIVILDACRNTPIARNPRVRSTGSGGLSEMTPPAGSLIAFATDAGRTANDGAGSNGLYTEELLKHLRAPGLTIEQVFKRTRAGVLNRSNGNQMPAEYSRLVGDDIYLAGNPKPAPAPAAPNGAPQARPVRTPSPREIGTLAANGKADECVAGLKQIAIVRGPGEFAIAPIETLLEQVKDGLKQADKPSPKVGSALRTCDLALEGLRECLPPDHPRRAKLTAKAQNRRGDCLLLFGRANEALAAYNVALVLTPDDAYIIYNRGRAHLALGNASQAKADFTEASNPAYTQAGARRLALEALEKMN